MANDERGNQLSLGHNDTEEGERSELAGAALEARIEQGVHNSSAAEDYVWPTDQKVREKLEWFRDQKLALMMHWGPYAQLGVVESWALSDADADWSRNGDRLGRQRAGVQATIFRTEQNV